MFLEKNIIYLKYIMNVLHTINNPEIGDIFELLNPPEPIWTYAVVTRIEGGDINLQPFDLVNPSHFVIPPALAVPPTAEGFGLNPVNTRFVLNFPYTHRHKMGPNGFLIYDPGRPPTKPPPAGGSKKRSIRRKRKGSKKHRIRRKQSIRKGKR
jgi:hypothetical protein